MKKTLSLFLTVILIVSSICTISFTASAESDVSKKISISNEKYAQGQAIVYMRTSSLTSLENSVYFGSNIIVKKVMKFNKSGSKNNVAALLTSTNYSTKELINIVAEYNEVKYAQPNYLKKASSLTDDTYSDYQWALNNNGQNGGTVDSDINVDLVWNQGVTSSQKVIAVVDSGVDFNNEDLQGCFWQNTSTRNLPGLHGYDFVNYDTNPQDDLGHGTHCAGIIAAAANNQKGISGVNQSAKIMALKVLDSNGYGYDDSILSALNYIYEAQCMGVNVVAVNMSFGSDEDSDIYNEIFNMLGQKGALLICASGNSGNNNDFNGSSPANADSPYCVSVAATNENDELASFSNYGKSSVDIAAPGTDILSTVNTNTYNPSIYSETQQSDLSCYYNNFNNAIETSSVKVTNYKNPSGTTNISLSDSISFGSSGKSLKVSISGAKEGDLYLVSIPYEVNDTIEDNETVQESFMIREDAPDAVDDYPAVIFVGDSKNDDESISNVPYQTDNYIGLYGTDNYWSHVVLENSAIQYDGQDRALVFAIGIMGNYKKDFTFYLDDVGISNPTSNTDRFGKYDFYNGTSMATPYVTGSVGLLSALHPDLTAMQLKALIMSSVRKTTDLEEKTVSGGVIDLSKALDLAKVSPLISETSSDSGKITVNGEFFGDSNIVARINGEIVTVISQNNNQVVLDASNYLYKKINLTLSNENGSTSCILRVNGLSKNFSSVSTSYGSSDKLISDGKALYGIDFDECSIYQVLTINQNDYFYSLDKYSIDNYLSSSSSDSSMITTFSELSTASSSKLFKGLSNGYMRFEEAYYLNGKVWIIANYATSRNNYKLISYTVSTGKWAIEGELPTDDVAQNYNNSTLTSYNGKLYLLGGFSQSMFEYEDTRDNAVTNMVRVFNPSTDKWTVGIDMPEARFGADARQVGDKLVVSFGSNGSTITEVSDDGYTVPKTMVYDGSSWSVSTTELKVDDFSTAYEFSTDEVTDFYGYDFYDDLQYFEVLPIFNSTGGISSGSVIYSGLYIDALGSCVSYSPEKDKFSTINYSLPVNSDETNVISASVGTKYYALSCETSDDDYDDEDDFSFSNVVFDEDYYFESYDDEDYSNETMYSFKISSGNVKVTAKTTNGGYVSGEGTYLPGQYVNLKAVSDGRHKYNYMNIAGTKYTSKSKTVLINKDITAKAYFKNIPVKKVKLNTAKKVIKPNKKFTLKAKINPTNSTQHTLIWTTSNKKIAVVSKKGVVTAKKAGKVKITCRVKGTKKVAKCVVIVK